MITHAKTHLHMYTHIHVHVYVFSSPHSGLSNMLLNIQPKQAIELTCMERTDTRISQRVSTSVFK